MDPIKQIQTLQNELARFTPNRQAPQAQAQAPAPASSQTQAAVVKIDRAAESAVKADSESPKEEATKTEAKEKSQSVQGGLDVEA